MAPDVIIATRKGGGMGSFKANKTPLHPPLAEETSGPLNTRLAV